jgi:hypothetical protein
MKTWSKSGYLTTGGGVLPGANSTGITFQQKLDEAGNYTVQFRVSSQAAISPTGAPDNITPEATIQWTIGGNVVQRKVSVYDGASLTGVGEMVHVAVADVTQNVSSPQKYLVAITVAEGTRGSNKQPPTYTNYWTAATGTNFGVVYVAHGTGQDLLVPPDVGIVSVHITAFAEDGSALPAGSVNVAQVDSGGQMLKQYDPRDYDWVPMSPQCVQLLLNNALTGGSAPRIRFGITFGVDG